MKLLNTLFQSKSVVVGVFRNAGWNIAGSICPLFAGVFAIPILIHHLGTDRFGVLTLAWALIGYLGLLDFGLGRAVTKFAAEKFSRGRIDEIPSIFWNALWALCAFGSIGAILLASFAPFLVNDVLRVPAALRMEVVVALRIIACAVPVVTVSTGVRAILEAQQRFAGISLIRAMSGVLGFLAPLVVLPFSTSLGAVIATLGCIRVCMLAALWIFASRFTPGLRKVQLPRFAAILELLRFGGWITVSSVLGPLMVYMDRFAIGAFVSVSAVAYYVTPHEIVTKLLIIPVAVQSAVFPVFSSMTASKDPKAASLYKKAIEVTIITLLPIVILVIVFAQEGLTLWLGKDFALHSYRIAQILALGLLINGIGHIPGALLQGSGRPDICAKLHMVEFPCYAFLCWVLIRHLGIQGAALAWVCRVTLDTTLLLYMAGLVVPRWPWRKLSVVMLGGVIIAAILLVVVHVPLIARIGLFIAVFSIVLAMAIPKFAALQRFSR